MKISTITSFCILHLTFLTALTAAEAASDYYLLSCGAPSSVSASPSTFDNRTWYSDQNSTFSPYMSTTADATARDHNTSVPKIPFSTARIFSSNFTYSFPVSAGPKFLRLYFYNTTYSSSSHKYSQQFLFSVEAVNYLLLNNFTAVPSDGYFMKEFHVIVPDQTDHLNLTFSPSLPLSYAFVNGIEIVSVPENLYINTMVPSQLDGSLALETMYRLNIGGEDVGAKEDGAVSGMYRRWVRDEQYMMSSDVAARRLGGKVNYTWMIPNYTAPEAVYSTYLRKGNSSTDKNLAWRLEVDMDYYYLVRVYWCTGASADVELHLYVNDTNTDAAVDLIQVTQALVPAYRDYIVYADGGRGGRGFLQLLLQPSSSNQGYSDIISSNGLEIFKLNNRSYGGHLPRRNSSTPIPQPPGGLPIAIVPPRNEPQGYHKKNKVLIAASSVVAGMVMLVCILVFSYLAMLKFNLISIDGCCFSSYLLTVLQKFKTNPHKGSAEDFLKNYASLVPRRYSYADIKKMTNTFREKLGEGGYGAVFKGKLQNGPDVAVKVWKQSKGDGEEFVNEVVSICRTNHINVVTLLGFCFEGRKRALIYEFMPNGSLEKFIHGRDANDNNQALPLQKLFEIAIGIARGLEYLHRGCNTRILHFDIKPHNILLDAEFTPKISDFGLSKSCNQKESKISMSGARGTAGYIAPEVFFKSFGGVSHKSDVYSYGMMVLEMVGCRKRVHENGENSSEMYFPQWIYKRFEQGMELNDGILDNDEKELERKMVLVGLWCIQTNPVSRPPMSGVVEMLEGKVELSEVPPMPSLSSLPRMQQPIDIDSSELSSSDQLQ